MKWKEPAVQQAARNKVHEQTQEALEVIPGTVQDDTTKNTYELKI